MSSVISAGDRLHAQDLLLRQHLVEVELRAVVASMRGPASVKANVVAGVAAAAYGCGSLSIVRLVTLAGCTAGPCWETSTLSTSAPLELLPSHDPRAGLSALQRRADAPRLASGVCAVPRPPAAMR